MPEQRPRVIVANLDCELDFAAAHPDLADRFCRPQMPAARRRRLGELAGALRVLGDANTELWLPRAAQPQPRTARPERILAWGETQQTERLRAIVAEPVWDGISSIEHSDLGRLLWSLPVATAETAARVNHRGFFLALCEHLDIALPGSEMIGSLAQVGRVCSQRQARHGWILKTPLSAAAQGHLSLPPGGPGGDRRLARRIEAQLRSYAELLLEPRLERLADFGCCAVVTPEDCRVVCVHQLLVDSRGRPTGISMRVDALTAPGLPAAKAIELTAIAERVGERLLANGYVGPFGIDAWLYRDGNRVALRAPGEINARLTFGFIARCWLERLVSKRPLATDEIATLHLSPAGDEDPYAAGEGAHLEISTAGESAAE